MTSWSESLTGDARTSFEGRDEKKKKEKRRLKRHTESGNWMHPSPSSCHSMLMPLCVCERGIQSVFLHQLLFSIRANLITTSSTSRKAGLMMQTLTQSERRGRRKHQVRYREDQWYLSFSTWIRWWREEMGFLRPEGENERREHTEKTQA